MHFYCVHNSFYLSYFQTYNNMPCHCLHLDMQFNYCVMIALCFFPFDGNIAILAFPFY
jgi:hypothetical protein